MAVQSVDFWFTMGSTHTYPAPNTARANRIMPVGVREGWGRRICTPLTAFGSSAALATAAKRTCAHCWPSAGKAGMSKAS